MASPSVWILRLFDCWKPSNHNCVYWGELWELVIKRGLDRLDFHLEPSLLRQALLEAGWRELPVEARHVLAVGQLPALHRDPFDCLLLAQAQADGLPLITAQ